MNKEELWKALNEPVVKRCYNCKHLRLSMCTKRVMDKKVCVWEYNKNWEKEYG